MTKLALKTKRQVKTSKGITLIALVITIIVLLILAGISIATLTGENGILTKANTGKEETQKMSAKEKVQIAVMGSFGTNGKIDIATFNKNLDQVEGIDKEKSNLPITILPTTVIVDNYKIIIGEKGEVTIEGSGDNTENPPETTLPSTDNTKPFLPEDSEIISDSLETGIIIKDKNNNEWVWIEVPKSIYSEETTSTDYTTIETAMQTYASAYRQSGCTDTFYSTAQHGFANTTEYNNHKNSMLSSVFNNGGFYIGRYETGTNTARFSKTASLTTPVIQRNAYPYNFVTCNQSQSKATELATGGKTSSLLFGIQWDLVLKFIEEKGTKTQAELNTNSGSWGNYKDVTFEITRGLYTTAPSTSGSWNQASETSKYTKPMSATTLLSTGATDRNSILGIYDLSGNIAEWTLEKSSSTGYPCASRGGSYSYTGSNSSAYRYTGSTPAATSLVGFRVALW